MTRDELITALESASEGSRELDGLVWVEILRASRDTIDGYGGPPEGAHFEYEADDRGKVSMYVRFASGIRSPLARAHRLAQNFTTSLDEAVTLIPENVSYELTCSAAGDGALRRARLWDWRRGPLMMDDPHNEWASEGHRPLPLAVCIAALRARASIEETKHD